MEPYSSINFNEPKNILLVDDIPKNIHLLTDIFTKNGFEVSTALNGFIALQYLESQTPDLILLDIKMPKMDGFEVCRKIKNEKKNRSIPIIFISALDEIDEKIKAFKAGGVDYITKPFQIEEVLARVNTHLMIQTMHHQLQTAFSDIETKVNERTFELQNALAEVESLRNRLKEENTYLQEEIKSSHNFTDIIGNSKALRKVLRLVEKAAPSDATVLINGETGTGKELLARALHERSNRCNRALVKVNCAALPENLIESELFGHEKGAFTGAISKKTGRFELADKGTIFLDEIGDLPQNLQAKLLRVLQEGEFERLGDTKTIKVNVRVIAATNRKLESLVENGSFRDDLYYRLSSFPIKSPALRERKEDLPLLIQHFVDLHSRKMGKVISSISQKTINNLKAYHWPGNIRELSNEIERAVILSSGEILEMRNPHSREDISLSRRTFPSLDEIQRTHILKALEITQGKISGESGAAKLLGMKPTTLDSRMKKLGIRISKTAS